MAKLTNAQLDLIKTGIETSVDPAMQAAVAARNDTEIANLLNVVGTVNAWAEEMSSVALFQAMDINQFDTITSAAKRETWRLMLDFAPLDMRQQENRQAVIDVWGTTNGQPLLQKCRRKMTLAELLVTPDIPANRATTSTVQGVKTLWNGFITPDDVGRLFNPSSRMAV